MRSPGQMSPGIFRNLTSATLPVCEENTMLKISFSETPMEEKWILEGRLSGVWVRELKASWKKNHQTDKKRACIVDLNEVTFIDKTGEGLLRVLRDEGAQFILGGCYVRHIVERLKVRRKRKISNLLASFLVVFVLVLFDTTATEAQSTNTSGSVPSGPATDQVVQLTLQDAIKMALRYNLGAIESGQNAQIARGQRLLALSNLLPQVSAGASENVEQVNLATFGLSGLKTGIPTVVGPFSYSSVDASVSQTLFSYESIQRFRAARTAEQAAQLSYQDILDVVTLTVGDAYLQIIEADSRIKAQEAQVQNARALYDRAADQVQAGTAPRIDATRTEVQLHTEEYNLSIARNNFAIAKLALGRAIGLPLGQQYELADSLPYSDITPLSVDDALQIAFKSRRDFRSALDSQKAAAQTLFAAKGERYPTVSVNGSYGEAR